MKSRLLGLADRWTAEMSEPFTVKPFWMGPVGNKRWRLAMAIRALYGYELGGFRAPGEPSLSIERDPAA